MIVTASHPNTSQVEMENVARKANRALIKLIIKIIRLSKWRFLPKQ
jgi:hypothetical protein